MIKKIALFLRLIILNWAFVLGFLTCMGIFAKYIFSPNNLYEDVRKTLSKDLFTIQKEDSEKNLNELIYNIYYHKY